MQMIQFRGNNLSAIMDFIMQPLVIETSLMDPEHPEIQITTSSGNLTARVGDWIVQDDDGTFRVEKASPTLQPSDIV